MINATSPLRAMRTLVIAALASMSALGAHTLGGESVHLGPLVLASMGAATALTFQMSRTQWQIGRLVTALAAIQILIHISLWISGDHAAHGTSSAPHTSVTAMMIWHIVATATSVTLIRHGERLIHHFARLAARLVPRSFVVTASTPRKRNKFRLDLTCTRLVSQFSFTGLSQRGPPAIASLL